MIATVTRRDQADAKGPPVGSHSHNLGRLMPDPSPDEQAVYEAELERALTVLESRKRRREGTLPDKAPTDQR